LPIPANITLEHQGTPIIRESTEFDVIQEEKRYSPKYVISIANVYANGTELDPSNFSGGDETNRFLKMS